MDVFVLSYQPKKHVDAEFFVYGVYQSLEQAIAATEEDANKVKKYSLEYGLIATLETDLGVYFIDRLEMEVTE